MESIISHNNPVGIAIRDGGNMQVGDLVTWKKFIGVITCIVYEPTGEVEVHWIDGEVTNMCIHDLEVICK